MKRGAQATIPFYMYNSSTHAGVTGLQDVAVRISKDGAATTAATNSAAEVDPTYLPGWYKVTLTTTEMDAGIIVLQATSATAVADPVVLGTSPADYATASALSSLQTHGDTEWSTATIPTSDIAAIKDKTDNLPSSPAATGDAMTLTAAYDAAKQTVDVAGALATYGASKTSDIPSVASIQSGLATGAQITALEATGNANWKTATGFAVAGDAMTLTSAYDAAKTPVDVGAALASYGTAKATDIPSVESVQTGLATSAEIAALQEHGDVAWAGATAAAVAQAVLTTPADSGKANTLQNALRAVTGPWVIENDTLKIKTATGTTVLSVALTKDSDGNFIGASI